MPFRILIVDDEAAIRKMLTIAFTKAGYQVASAQDALEAMDLLAIEKPQPEMFSSTGKQLSKTWRPAGRDMLMRRPKRRGEPRNRA